MSDAAATPTPWTRRLRLRFGLRTLLVVVTAAGLLCAWVTSAQRQRESVAALRAANPAAMVAYDYATDESASPKSWIIRRLGIDFGASPSRHRRLLSNRCRHAARRAAQRSASLYLLRAIDLTDAGVDGLLKLTHLRKLTIIDDDQLTDRALATIGRLSQLELLRLDIPRDATDKGLAELANLKNLTDLRLCFRGDIHDYLGDHITRAGIESLRRAMPHCQITIVTDLMLTMVSDLQHTTGVQVLPFWTRDLAEADRRGMR